MRIATPVNVAIFVIGLLLLGILLPGIIGKTDFAKTKATKSQIDRLIMSIESYRLDVGTQPLSLDALVSNIGQFDDWNGPYIKTSLLKDPWGNPYIYESSDAVFRVMSYGADNKPGGENRDADVAVKTDVDE